MTTEFSEDAEIKSENSLKVYNSGNTEYTEIKRDNNYFYIQPGDADHLWRKAGATSYHKFYFETYSAGGGQRSIIYLRKSDSNTLGDIQETGTGENIGAIYWEGVNSSDTFAMGGRIHCVQDGNSSTYVPTKMEFETYSASAINNDQLVLLSDGGIKMTLKSGTTQALAGAAAGELWVDTNDSYTVKMGV